MRTIVLRFDDKKFEKIKKLKQSEAREEWSSWEKFVEGVIKEWQEKQAKR